MKSNLYRLCSFILAIVLLLCSPTSKDTVSARKLGPGFRTNPLPAALPQQEGNNHLELVSQLGGGSFAVKVDGSFAYIGTGARLSVIDITNPALPVLVSRSGLLNSFIYDIEIQGTYAYLATVDSDGLVVMDIANPFIPVIVSRFPVATGHVLKVNGNYAFVGSQNQLLVVDISDPANPWLASAFYGSNEIFGIALSGNYAYICSVYGGFTALDISTPTSPVEVDSLAIKGQGIDIYGDYAYLANGSNELTVLDISTPSDVKQIGAYTEGYNYWNVRVLGDYAYVGNRLGLDVINISNPTTPTFVTQIRVLDWGVYDTDVSGSKAYLVSSDSGLHVIDLADPAEPVEIGLYQTMGEVRDVAVKDNIVYVTSELDGLFVVDSADPSNPTVIARFNDPQYVRGISIQDDYAYVSARNDGLYVLDIHNPANPIVTDTYDTPGTAQHTEVKNGYAYVADWYKGLRSINALDPHNLFEVGSYSPPDAVWDLAVSNSFAYLADMSSGLRQVDISDPSHLQELAHFATPSQVRAVAVKNDNLVVAADENNGLFIIQASPGSLQEIATFPVLGLCMDVEIEGDLAYTTGFNKALIVDISDPYHPHQVASASLPSISWGIAAQGDMVYVANLYGGLYIFRRTYTISGQVADESGALLQGVKLSDGKSYETTTNESGTYTITNVTSGTYTIIPTVAGYTFDPPTRTITVPPDASDQNFVGTEQFHPIKVFLPVVIR